MRESVRLSQAAARYPEHLCRLSMLGIPTGSIGPNFCPANSQAPSSAAAAAARRALAALDATGATAVTLEAVLMMASEQP